MNSYSYEELNDLINIQGLSYLEIGKMYGVSGSAIKSVAKRKGVPIPKRRIINENETFNKGKSRYEKSICIECGKEFIQYPNKYGPFCSHKCQHSYQEKQSVEKWKNGESSGCGKRYKLSSPIRRYLLNKANYRCSICGFDIPNPFTGQSILQIHHIDGNAANTKEENLQVLCPNCHALTENFDSRNKNSIRQYRKEDYIKEQSR